jgi:hypothetical protein
MNIPTLQHCNGANGSGTVDMRLRQIVMIVQENNEEEIGGKRDFILSIQIFIIEK